jgi:polyhydroxyalkanoate synthesis regulator phasin
MDDLRDRVAAIERAISDGEGDLSALAEGAATAERVDALQAELESLADEVDELAAATQALRGYVGSVRSVNQSVEERADAAMAAVDALEERLADLEAGDGSSRSIPAADSGAAGGTGVGESGTNRLTGNQPTGLETTDRGPRSGPDFGPSGDGRPRSRVGSESLDGFDPDGTGSRVRVRPSEPDTEDGPEASSDGRVVDLVRNLL